MSPLSGKSAYIAAAALTFAASVFLYWVIGAVGLIGVEGDSFDKLYAAVLIVGAIGALIARFRPRGMALALFSMAATQVGLTVAALIAGKHLSPVTSVPELVGVNAIFVVLFSASAWLFLRADKPAQTASA